MVTGIIEVAAAYQTIQPIASLQIQLIKDIYETIKYIRELANEYKTRFETHTKLVEEVDSHYLRLGKLIEGLEQLSNGNTLDDANRESIDRKLNLLRADLQRIETRLKTFMEQMTVEGGNPNTTMRKFKRFFGGLDFVSASREELQTILDTSRIWSDSITVELTLLLVMDNHKVIHEKVIQERSGWIISEDRDCKESYYESFKPLNVSKIAPDIPIMRLVKRITTAKEKALAIYGLNVEDLQKQIISDSDYKNDIMILKPGRIAVFKGSSRRFAHCIMDHERELLYNPCTPQDYPEQFLMEWLKETMFLATVLSSDQSNSRKKRRGEIESTLQDINILPVCVGVIGSIEESNMSHYRLNYIFQLPPSVDPNVLSLRTALLDPSSQNHPIEDRYSLALHLAQSLFLIHSAGIIHKQVRPESVLLADRLESYKEDKYPERLGRAFLFGYGQTRSNVILSHKMEFERYPERTEVYRPPRHLIVSGQRIDRYRMIDDIYGLGVCLLEIGLWTSLFKPFFRGCVDNDEVINFKDAMSPYDVQKKLIQKAQNGIPRKSGTRFMKIVVSCIDCFNNEIPGGFGELGVEASPAKLLRKYEEIVLNKLRELVDHD